MGSNTTELWNIIKAIKVLHSDNSKGFATLQDYFEITFFGSDFPFSKLKL